MTPTPSTGTTSAPSGTARCSGSPDAPPLRLDAVTFAYAGGTAAPAVEGVSLAVGAGSFFALLGASGSGKSTLLKLVGGYLTPDRGRVHLAGSDVTDLPPERRQVGTVFQSYALFPHLSARRNVAFGLEVRGVARPECGRRVEEMLDRVGLDGAARDRRPAALSGGQQQRVALARALVIRPHLLLLDEPLTSLDRRLRDQLRQELRRVQRDTGVTALLVTHDPEEALALADRVGVMARGRLLQEGEPRELFDRPCCPYVARLLGDANLLTVQSRSESAVTFTGGLRLPLSTGLSAASPGDVVLVRPGRVLLGQGSPAVVADTSYRGEQSLVELRVEATRLLAACPSAACPARGETVLFHVAGESCWLVPQRDPAGLGG